MQLCLSIWAPPPHPQFVCWYQSVHRWWFVVFLSLFIQVNSQLKWTFSLAEMVFFFQTFSHLLPHTCTLLSAILVSVYNAHVAATGLSMPHVSINIHRATRHLSPSCTLWPNIRSLKGILREPVWPSGKQKDLGSNLLLLSFLFKSCGLWTLSCDFVPHNYETLKWFSSLPTVMQKSFWWWQCIDRYVISPPSPPPPTPTSIPPFPPSPRPK